VNVYDPSVPVTNAAFTHSPPWTEEEYLALGETMARVELIDGGLWVTPSGDFRHQAILGNFQFRLRPAAKAAGLRLLWNLNVRLAPLRIVNPDLVAGRFGGLGDIVEAADIVMLGEITSPGTAAVDRLQKMQFYAEARIAWYLLAEPDMADYKSVTLRLLRLDGDRYVEHTVAEHGETLISDDPFRIEIQTGDLFVS